MIARFANDDNERTRVHTSFLGFSDIRLESPELVEEPLQALLFMYEPFRVLQVVADVRAETFISWVAPHPRIHCQHLPARAELRKVALEALQKALVMLVVVLEVVLEVLAVQFGVYELLDAARLPFGTISILEVREATSNEHHVVAF